MFFIVLQVFFIYVFTSLDVSLALSVRNDLIAFEDKLAPDSHVASLLTTMLENQTWQSEQKKCIFRGLKEVEASLAPLVSSREKTPFLDEKKSVSVVLQSQSDQHDEVGTLMQANVTRDLDGVSVVSTLYVWDLSLTSDTQLFEFSRLVRLHMQSMEFPLSDISIVYNAYGRLQLFVEVQGDLSLDEEGLQNLRKKLMLLEEQAVRQNQQNIMKISDQQEWFLNYFNRVSSLSVLASPKLDMEDSCWDSLSLDHSYIDFDRLQNEFLYFISNHVHAHSSHNNWSKHIKFRNIDGNRVAFLDINSLFSQDHPVDDALFAQLFNLGPYSSVMKVVPTNEKGFFQLQISSKDRSFVFMQEKIVYAATICNFIAHIQRKGELWSQLKESALEAFTIDSFIKKWVDLLDDLQLKHQLAQQKAQEIAKTKQDIETLQDEENQDSFAQAASLSNKVEQLEKEIKELESQLEENNELTSEYNQQVIQFFDRNALNLDKFLQIQDRFFPNLAYLYSKWNLTPEQFYNLIRKELKSEVQSYSSLAQEDQKMFDNYEEQYQQDQEEQERERVRKETLLLEEQQRQIESQKLLQEQRRKEADRLRQEEERRQEEKRQETDRLRQEEERLQEAELLRQEAEKKEKRANLLRQEAEKKKKKADLLRQDELKREEEEAERKRKEADLLLLRQDKFKKLETEGSHENRLLTEKPQLTSLLENSSVVKKKDGLDVRLTYVNAVAKKTSSVDLKILEEKVPETHYVHPLKVWLAVFLPVMLVVLLLSVLILCLGGLSIMMGWATGIIIAIGAFYGVFLTIAIVSLIVFSVVLVVRSKRRPSFVDSSGEDKDSSSKKSEEHLTVGVSNALYSNYVSSLHSLSRHKKWIIGIIAIIVSLLLGSLIAALSGASAVMILTVVSIALSVMILGVLILGGIYVIARSNKSSARSQKLARFVSIFARIILILGVLGLILFVSTSTLPFVVPILVPLIVVLGVFFILPSTISALVVMGGHRKTVCKRNKYFKGGVFHAEGKVTGVFSVILFYLYSVVLAIFRPGALNNKESYVAYSKEDAFLSFDEKMLAQYEVSHLIRSRNATITVWMSICVILLIAMLITVLTLLIMNFVQGLNSVGSVASNHPPIMTAEQYYNSVAEPGSAPYWIFSSNPDLEAYQVFLAKYEAYKASQLLVQQVAQEAANKAAMIAFAQSSTISKLMLGFAVPTFFFLVLTAFFIPILVYGFYGLTRNKNKASLEDETSSDSSFLSNLKDEEEEDSDTFKGVVEDVEFDEENVNFTIEGHSLEDLSYNVRHQFLPTSVSYSLLRKALIGFLLFILASIFVVIFALMAQGIFAVHAAIIGVFVFATAIISVISLVLLIYSFFRLFFPMKKKNKEEVDLESEEGKEYEVRSYFHVLPTSAKVFILIMFAIPLLLLFPIVGLGIFIWMIVHAYRSRRWRNSLAGQNAQKMDRTFEGMLRSGLVYWAEDHAVDVSSVDTSELLDSVRPGIGVTIQMGSKSVSLPVLHKRAVDEILGVRVNDEEEDVDSISGHTYLHSLVVAPLKRFQKTFASFTSLSLTKRRQRLKDDIEFSQSFWEKYLNLLQVQSYDASEFKDDLESMDQNASYRWAVRHLRRKLNLPDPFSQDSQEKEDSDLTDSVEVDKKDETLDANALKTMKLLHKKELRNDRLLLSRLSGLERRRKLEEMSLKKEHFREEEQALFNKQRRAKEEDKNSRQIQSKKEKELKNQEKELLEKYEKDRALILEIDMDNLLGGAKESYLWDRSQQLYEREDQFKKDLKNLRQSFSSKMESAEDDDEEEEEEEEEEDKAEDEEEDKAEDEEVKVKSKDDDLLSLSSDVVLGKKLVNIQAKELNLKVSFDDSSGISLRDKIKRFFKGGDSQDDLSLIVDQLGFYSGANFRSTQDILMSSLYLVMDILKGALGFLMSFLMSGIFAFYLPISRAVRRRGLHDVPTSRGINIALFIGLIFLVVVVISVIVLGSLALAQVGPFVALSSSMVFVIVGMVGVVMVSFCTVGFFYAVYELVVSRFFKKRFHTKKSKRRYSVASSLFIILLFISVVVAVVGIVLGIIFNMWPLALGLGLGFGFVVPILLCIFIILPLYLSVRKDPRIRPRVISSSDEDLDEPVKTHVVSRLLRSDSLDEEVRLPVPPPVPSRSYRQRSASDPLIRQEGRPSIPKIETTTVTSSPLTHSSSQSHLQSSSLVYTPQASRKKYTASQSFLKKVIEEQQDIQGIVSTIHQKTLELEEKLTAFPKKSTQKSHLGLLKDSQDAAAKMLELNRQWMLKEEEGQESFNFFEKVRPLMETISQNLKIIRESIELSPNDSLQDELSFLETKMNQLKNKEKKLRIPLKKNDIFLKKPLDHNGSHGAKLSNLRSPLQQDLFDPPSSPANLDDLSITSVENEIKTYVNQLDLVLRIEISSVLSAEDLALLPIMVANMYSLLEEKDWKQLSRKLNFFKSHAREVKENVLKKTSSKEAIERSFSLLDEKISSLENSILKCIQMSEKHSDLTSLSDSLLSNPNLEADSQFLELQSWLSQSKETLVKHVDSIEKIYNHLQSSHGFFINNLYFFEEVYLTRLLESLEKKDFQEMGRDLSLLELQLKNEFKILNYYLNQEKSDKIKKLPIDQIKKIKEDVASSLSKVSEFRKQFSLEPSSPVQLHLSSLSTSTSQSHSLSDGSGEEIQFKEFSDLENSPFLNSMVRDSLKAIFQEKAHLNSLEANLKGSLNLFNRSQNKDRQLNIRRARDLLIARELFLKEVQEGVFKGWDDWSYFLKNNQDFLKEVQFFEDVSELQKNVKLWETALAPLSFDTISFDPPEDQMLLLSQVEFAFPQMPRKILIEMIQMKNLLASIQVLEENYPSFQQTKKDTLEMISSLQKSFSDLYLKEEPVSSFSQWLFYKQQLSQINHFIYSLNEKNLPDGRSVLSLDQLESMREMRGKLSVLVGQIASFVERPQYRFNKTSREGYIEPSFAVPSSDYKNILLSVNESCLGCFEQVRKLLVHENSGKSLKTEGYNNLVFLERDLNSLFSKIALSNDSEVSSLIEALENINILVNDLLVDQYIKWKPFPNFRTTFQLFQDDLKVEISKLQSFQLSMEVPVVSSLGDYETTTFVNQLKKPRPSSSQSHRKERRVGENSVLNPDDLNVSLPSSAPTYLEVPRNPVMRHVFQESSSQHSLTEVPQQLASEYSLIQAPQQLASEYSLIQAPQESSSQHSLTEVPQQLASEYSLTEVPQQLPLQTFGNDPQQHIEPLSNAHDSAPNEFPSLSHSDSYSTLRHSVTTPSVPSSSQVNDSTVPLYSVLNFSSQTFENDPGQHIEPLNHAYDFFPSHSTVALDSPVDALYDLPPDAIGMEDVGYVQPSLYQVQNSTPVLSESLSDYQNMERGSLFLSESLSDYQNMEGGSLFLSMLEDENNSVQQFSLEALQDLHFAEDMKVFLAEIISFLESFQGFDEPEPFKVDSDSSLQDQLQAITEYQSKLEESLEKVEGVQQKIESVKKRLKNEKRNLLPVFRVYKTLLATQEVPLSSSQIKTLEVLTQILQNLDVDFHDENYVRYIELFRKKQSVNLDLGSLSLQEGEEAQSKRLSLEKELKDLDKKMEHLKHWIDPNVDDFIVKVQSVIAQRSQSSTSFSPKLVAQFQFMDHYRNQFDQLISQCTFQRNVLQETLAEVKKLHEDTVARFQNREERYIERIQGIKLLSLPSLTGVGINVSNDITKEIISVYKDSSKDASFYDLCVKTFASSQSQLSEKCKSFSFLVSLVQSPDKKFQETSWRGFSEGMKDFLVEWRQSRWQEPASFWEGREKVVFDEQGKKEVDFLIQKYSELEKTLQNSYFQEASPSTYLSMVTHFYQMSIIYQRLQDLQKLLKASSENSVLLEDGVPSHLLKSVAERLQLGRVYLTDHPAHKLNFEQSVKNSLLFSDEFQAHSQPHKLGSLLNHSEDDDENIKAVQEVHKLVDYLSIHLDSGGDYLRRQLKEDFSKIRENREHFPSSLTYNLLDGSQISFSPQKLLLIDRYIEIFSNLTQANKSKWKSLLLSAQQFSIKQELHQKTKLHYLLWDTKKSVPDFSFVVNEVQAIEQMEALVSRLLILSSQPDSSEFNDLRRKVKEDFQKIQPFQGFLSTQGSSFVEVKEGDSVLVYRLGDKKVASISIHDLPFLYYFQSQLSSLIQDNKSQWVQTLRQLKKDLNEMKSVVSTSLGGKLGTDLYQSVKDQSQLYALNLMGSHESLAFIYSLRLLHWFHSSVPYLAQEMSLEKKSLDVEGQNAVESEGQSATSQVKLEAKKVAPSFSDFSAETIRLNEAQLVEDYRYYLDNIHDYTYPSEKLTSRERLEAAYLWLGGGLKQLTEEQKQYARLIIQESPPLDTPVNLLKEYRKAFPQHQLEKAFRPRDMLRLIVWQKLHDPSPPVDVWVNDNMINPFFDETNTQLMIDFSALNPSHTSLARHKGDQRLYTLLAVPLFYGHFTLSGLLLKEAGVDIITVREDTKQSAFEQQALKFKIRSEDLKAVKLVEDEEKVPQPNHLLYRIQKVQERHHSHQHHFEDLKVRSDFVPEKSSYNLEMLDKATQYGQKNVPIQVSSDVNSLLSDVPLQEEVFSRAVDYAFNYMNFLENQQNPSPSLVNLNWEQLYNRKRPLQFQVSNKLPFAAADLAGDGQVTIHSEFLSRLNQAYKQASEEEKPIVLKLIEHAISRIVFHEIFHEIEPHTSNKDDFHDVMRPFESELAYQLNRYFLNQESSILSSSERVLKDSLSEIFEEKGVNSFVNELTPSLGLLSQRLTQIGFEIVQKLPPSENSVNVAIQQILNNLNDHSMFVMSGDQIRLKASVFYDGDLHVLSNYLEDNWRSQDVFESILSLNSDMHFIERTQRELAFLLILSHFGQIQIQPLLELYQDFIYRPEAYWDDSLCVDFSQKKAFLMNQIFPRLTPFEFYNVTEKSSIKNRYVRSFNIIGLLLTGLLLVAGLIVLGVAVWMLLSGVMSTLFVVGTFVFGAILLSVFVIALSVILLSFYRRSQSIEKDIDRVSSHYRYKKMWSPFVQVQSLVVGVFFILGILVVSALVAGAILGASSTFILVFSGLVGVLGVLGLIIGALCVYRFFKQRFHKTNSKRLALGLVVLMAVFSLLFFMVASLAVVTSFLSLSSFFLVLFGFFVALLSLVGLIAMFVIFMHQLVLNRQSRTRARHDVNWRIVEGGRLSQRYQRRQQLSRQSKSYRNDYVMRHYLASGGNSQWSALYSSLAKKKWSKKTQQTLLYIQKNIRSDLKNQSKEKINSELTALHSYLKKIPKGSQLEFMYQAIWLSFDLPFEDFKKLPSQLPLSNFLNRVQDAIDVFQNTQAFLTLDISLKTKSQVEIESELYKIQKYLDSSSKVKNDYQSVLEKLGLLESHLSILNKEMTPQQFMDRVRASVFNIRQKAIEDKVDLSNYQSSVNNVPEDSNEHARAFLNLDVSLRDQSFSKIESELYKVQRYLEGSSNLQKDYRSILERLGFTGEYSLLSKKVTPKEFVLMLQTFIVDPFSEDFRDFLDQFVSEVSVMTEEEEGSEIYAKVNKDQIKKSLKQTKLSNQLKPSPVSFKTSSRPLSMLAPAKQTVQKVDDSLLSNYQRSVESKFESMLSSSDEFIVQKTESSGQTTYVLNGRPFSLKVQIVGGEDQSELVRNEVDQHNIVISLHASLQELLDQQEDEEVRSHLLSVIVENEVRQSLIQASMLLSAKQLSPEQMVNIEFLTLISTLSHLKSTVSKTIYESVFHSYQEIMIEAWIHSGTQLLEQLKQTPLGLKFLENFQLENVSSESICFDFVQPMMSQIHYFIEHFSDSSIEKIVSVNQMNHFFDKIPFEKTDSLNVIDSIRQNALVLKSV